MSFLDNLIERFIRINHKMKRWQRTVSALSAVIVFITTYALILPAITLDKDTAQQQPGIEVAASEGNVEKSRGAVIEETPEEELSPEEPAEPEETVEEGSEESEQTIADEPEYNDGDNESADAGNDTLSGESLDDEEPEYIEDTEPEEKKDEESGNVEDEKPEDSGEILAEEAEAGAAEIISDDITDTGLLSAEDLAAAIAAGEIPLITERTQLVYEYIDEEYEKNKDENRIEENDSEEAGENSDEEKDDVDDGYFVYAEFDGSAKLPEGVELQVKEITEESDPDLYAMYREKTLSEVQDKYDENTGITFAKFYDISFVYQGIAVEPGGDVKIRIEYKREIEVKKDETVGAIHFDKENDERPELIESEVNPDDKEKDRKEEQEENRKSDGEAAPMKAVEFTSDRFSVYGVVGTGSITTTFRSTDGNTYEVTVNCGTDANIPAGSELVVSEVEATDDKYDEYLASAAEAMDVSADKIAYAKLLDISIVNGEEEIIPEMPVNVEIKLLDRESDNENESLNVIHYESGEENPVLVDGLEQDGVVSFEAEGFSVYGVFYTVDFWWEVNGKKYEISIPGGGFLSFEKLVEILEIAKTDQETDPVNNQGAKTESDAAAEETQINDENSDESDKKDVFLLALKDVQVSEETKEFVAKVDHIEFSNPELLWVDKVSEECTVSDLKEVNNLEVQYSDELTEEQIDEINAQKVETGDWALISLQQFYTEETLKVTMTNGNSWSIRVTDAVAENPVRNPGTVNTVDTYADGVKMWLFNYDTDGNLDDSSNKIKFNGTNHTGKVGFNNNTLASDGINGYSGLKFLGWGSDSDYNITSNVDINNFTGLDESGQGKGNKIKALLGIVQNSLDENGYPVLNSQYSSTSLTYLFDPTANTSDRVVYGGENGNVTNLFRKENGYYKFDSNQHYAQFDGDHTFTVYDTTIPQTDKNGNKHNPTRAVGFFPFNSYNNMLGIWDTNQNQNGSHTLYLNPDRDTSKTDRAGVKDLDHHFGVMLEAKFVLPADGKDENGNPIRFDFSGDDDMWVFIDDELVLDIGGIHQPVSGTIDFQYGKAYVVGDHTVAGHSDNTGTNAVATAYGAGVTRNSTGDGNYYFYNDDSVGKKVQLGDGKVHTMKIFYIERGGCDSNCEITFNLPTVKTGNLDLKKVWGDVERQAEEVYYTITANYKEASDANKRDLAKFFSTMKEKELSQYGLTKNNIKQIDANNDGVLDNNDPYVFVVKGSDWELKLKQLRICQDSLQNGNLTHDQVPLTYTVLERYALVDGKIVDATDQYSQAIEKSGAPLPSTSDIILGENDVSLWQDTTGNNASFNVTNGPGTNVTVNKDWAQECDPLSDTTITGVVKRYKLVDKGNTLTIQSVLEDADNSGVDFSGVTYTVMKNGQQVGEPISFADAQAGKNLELPDSGPYTVVENNVPGTPQGYSVVHDPQNQQHSVTLDPSGNTTVTFTSTYKQVNKPSNSTFLIRDYYYYNYQNGKDLASGNIEFPVGAQVIMKFKCKNGFWAGRDMKAEYNGETVNITASAADYNQNLEFTVGPFTVVENGRLMVDVNTNGNNNHDGFVSGSVNFIQVRSLNSYMRAMHIPLKAAPQKTDLTFSQELNETTLASLPAAPEGKHYVLDNWSKEVKLDAASDWTKTVAVDVGNNYGDYYYFLASVTEHNVTPDTRGTIKTNNDGSIRFAHKHADNNLPFEIENKIEKGSLKISKSITENGSSDNVASTVKSLLAGEYTFTIYKNEACTEPYEEVAGTPKTVKITIGADGATAYSEEVTGLRMGDYWIKETFPSNGSEPVTNPVKVTVIPGATGSASPIAAFTNNYETTDISATKAWINPDLTTNAPDGAKVTFELYADTVATGKTVELDGKTLAEEIEAIRADDTKTEEEKTAAIEALESTLYGEFTAWKAEWKSLPKYSDVVNKTLISYTVKETSSFGLYENKNPEGVASGGTITNELKTFKLDILKVDRTDHNKKLKDAVFTLRKMASDVIPVNDIKYADDTIYGTATTGTDGKAEFKDITYGFYEVKETVAPAGYVFDGEHAFYIKVFNEGVQLIKKDLAVAPENWEVVETYGDVFSFTYAASSNTASASVENTPGTALPNTGGPGTTLLTILGIMLMAFAGTGMLVMKKRRRSA